MEDAQGLIELGLVSYEKLGCPFLRSAGPAARAALKIQSRQVKVVSYGLALDDEAQLLG